MAHIIYPLGSFVVATIDGSHPEPSLPGRRVKHSKMPHPWCIIGEAQYFIAGIHPEGDYYEAVIISHNPADPKARTKEVLPRLEPYLDFDDTRPSFMHMSRIWLPVSNVRGWVVGLQEVYATKEELDSIRCQLDVPITQPEPTISLAADEWP